MILHQEITDQALYQLLKNNKITFGGNIHLKIYGRLNCSSGRRMLRKNRVFFASEQEAITYGFRPCGICMKVHYYQWRKGSFNDVS